MLEGYLYNLLYWDKKRNCNVIFFLSLIMNKKKKFPPYQKIKWNQCNKKTKPKKNKKKKKTLDAKQFLLHDYGTSYNNNFDFTNGLPRTS